MSSKWIEVPSPDAPAAKVARRALAARLTQVKAMLPLAAFEYQEDVEYAHQLRTSCRRATAALDAFRPLMCNNPKPLRKLLRQIHKAAGPARDADVLLARCQKETSAEANLEELIGQLCLQRESVQGSLTKIAKKPKLFKLEKAIRQTLKNLKRGHVDARRMSFAQFARQALQNAGRAMFRLIDNDQPTVDQLHQLRIAGKRLRYSIEMFHGVFAPELRQEIYPVVEALQERLGQMNDHATAQAMYQRWLVELPPGRRAADLALRIVAEYEFTVEVRREFLDWWMPQRSAALKAQLDRLLRPTN